MSGINHQTSGFGTLNWDILTGEQAPVVWTIDPADGVIQGPVDLCFLNDKLLYLTLLRGQAAVLAASDGRSAFFQDGGYLLRIGNGGLPADGLLYFMHTDRAFDISWEQIIPVPRSEHCVPTTRLASGSFGVRIESPLRFHAEMLSSRAGEGENICRDVLSRVMPTLLTIRLAHDCGREATTAKQREALAALAPSDLNPDLAPYGLACTTLRIDDGFLSPQQPVSVV